MKQLFCVLSFWVLFAVVSQSVLAQGPPPPPPPPPAKDYSPQIWQEFSYPEIGFKIKFPGEPKRSTTVRESSTGKRIINSLAYGSASFINYDLVCTEHPQSIEISGNVNQFLDGFREGVLSLILPKANYRILSESDISVEGGRGRMLQVEVEQKKMLRVKTLAVGQRVYMLMVLTSIHPPGSMGAENGYEKIAMSFLDSFQLIKAADKK